MLAEWNQMKKLYRGSYIDVQGVSEENFFLTLANQKQELLLAAIFVGQMERNEETLLRTLHRSFLPNLAPFGQAVSEEKICLTLANQKKELLLAAMFIGRMEANEEAL